MSLTVDKIWSHYLSDGAGKITYKDIKIDYSEAYKIINGTVRFLNKKDIGKDSIVTVMDFNTLDHYILQNAVPMSGAIINSMNIMLSPKDIKKIIDKIDPDLIFINQILFPTLSEIIRGRDYIIIDGKWSYENFNKNIETINYDYLTENQPAQIVLTSGTTGDPKMILYTHKQVIEAIWAISSLLSTYEGPAKLTSNDNAMAIIPMYHIFGWGMVYIPQLIGFNLVLDGKFVPSDALNTIKNNDVTWINAVPTMVNFLMAYQKNNELSGLKILLGGSSISEKLKNQILKLNMEFASIYGFSDGLIAGIGRINSSESNLSLEDIEEKLRTSVTLAPFASVKIEKLENSDYGKIYFSAPWLPDKYYLYDRENYKNGWFYTGDIGMMNSDGRLTVMDREKDLIKSGGEWIPSAVLESIISSFTGVNLCAVVGIEDEKWGERPVAIVNEGINNDELMNYLKSLVDNGTLNKWWLPERIYNIENFPLSGTGKINKRELKSLFMKK